MLNERVEKLLLTPVLLTLLYTTWVWGGGRLSFHKPVLWVAGLLLVMLFLLPLFLAPSVERLHTLGRNVRKILLDPFFFSGLLFVAYLVIQLWNAGRTLVFDIPSAGWIYSQPRVPGWPSAFTKKEALQMIEWFFPAWVLVLTLRSDWFQRGTLQKLLYIIVYSSGLLSLFGLVQYGSKTHSIYWQTPLDCHFFASFGYSNHAAAYFVLTGALATGLLFREIFRPGEKGKRLRITLLILSTVLCMTGANLSLSRAGVILAWSFMLLAAIYGLKRAWKQLSPAARANMLAATLGIVGIFYFLVAGFGEEAIINEFIYGADKLRPDQTILRMLYTELAERPFLCDAAWRIWKDNELFGIGGWGYRYLLALYVQRKFWMNVGLQGGGWANVHCDPLQFLLEFGAVGFGLLLLSIVMLLFAVFRQAEWRSSLLWMSLSGLALVGVFSLIDLPFRCPAILYTWVTILAVMPKLTRRETRVKLRGTPQ